MKKSQAALENRVQNAITLHLEEFQTRDMIEIIQNRVTEAMKTLDSINEPRLKAFDEYQKLQDRYDSVKSKHDADKRLLDSLSKYHNNIKEGVDIRIVRGESHVDMKDREKRKYVRKKGHIMFTWTSYAEGTLKELGKFIKINELWEFVVDKYDLSEKISSIPNGGHSKVRWGAIHNCWLANAAKTREGKGKGSLIAYENGYIGLKEWAYDDYKPRPEYIPNGKAVV